MQRLPLPVLDPSRTEFGFERTQCACFDCSISCRYVPGYLVPADLSRIVAFHSPGVDGVFWAKNHLLASPGALVARNGQLYRIPTLVPARHKTGACIFLTAEGTCGIHAVAPFGCAFFDHHMSHAQADRRSKCGLSTIVQALQSGGLYAHVWALLHQAGRVAPAPELARRQMHQAL